MKFNFIKTSRKAMIVSCVSLALTCVGICPASAQERPVVVSQLFQSIQLLPLYVAMDGGFFKQAGLSVSKHTAGSANAALSALISGSADFSVHGPEWTAVAVEKGAAVEVIASVVSRPSFWIAAAPDVKFSSIADLKEQTVVTGLMPTTSSSMFFKLLKQSGLDPSRDLTVTQVQIGSEPGPLLAGQAKFGVLYEPGLDQVAARGLKVVYSFTEMADAYTVAAVSARRNVDPDTATRFVNGLQHALRYMQADVQGTIKIARAEFPSLPTPVVEAAVKRMIGDHIYSPSVDITPSAFENSMATQVDLGNLKAAPKYDDVVSRRFIKTAIDEKP